jgi:hypothetical protein
MPPTTVNLEVSSPEQEALLRSFHGLLQELEQLALSAPAGQVIDQCEAAVLQRGQEVNRQVLQQAVQKRIAAGKPQCRPPPSRELRRDAAAEAALVGQPLWV